MVNSAPNDGQEYTLKSKKTSGTPTFYWVDGTGYVPTLDLLFAADKSLTPYVGPTPKFSRASTGSYFDGSGVLRYANVNTYLYSESFSNAWWTKYDATAIDSATTAPDGKNTATKIVESSTNYLHGLEGAINVSATSVFSVYAKKSERSIIQLTCSGIGSFNANFDLNSGTICFQTPGSTALIQNVGNGWYRCSLYMPANSNKQTIFMQIDPSAVRNTAYSGNGSSGIYIWGAQVESVTSVTATPGTYCPTTSSANSAPRFNHTYNGTSWVSRGLLVEEQRTNILLQSGFASGWGTSGGTLAQTSDISSLDGTNNAYKFTDATTSTNHGFYQNIPVSSGSTYSTSIYLKYGNHRYVRISFVVNGGVDSVYVDVDLLSGTIVNSGPYGSATQSSQSISNAGNGWYRVSITGTLPGTSVYLAIYHRSSSSNSNPENTNAYIVTGKQIGRAHV